MRSVFTPPINFAERTIGIKAKRRADLPRARRDFAERTIGIKAKRCERRFADGEILPKEQLESRQSVNTVFRFFFLILPKEQLESRQSSTPEWCKSSGILPKEQLESRQSDNFPTVNIESFCRKNNWNQGKALAALVKAESPFCRKNNWNQGKARLSVLILVLSFCRKNNWNQGKAPIF